MRIKPPSATAIKRLADWLEKFSVGSALVGIYQSSWIGILVGIISLVASVLLTKGGVK
jgi:hypothetical protein